MGDLPGTMSISTAFLAICVAALCTILGRPRLEQNRDMKSPVVIRSTLVSRALRISLKHRPISFLLILLTAQISLNVRGTPSCRQAMYKHAEAIASFARPFRFLPSCTCLNNVLALSTIVFAVPKPSKDAAPVPGPIIVDKSALLRSGFSGPPTRDGSTPDFSLLNVLHSEPTSITLLRHKKCMNVNQIYWRSIFTLVSVTALPVSHN
ncbi:hypothetical protein ALC56_03453 [Trachymyrmex septentrionalis]|uniref:Uncharacterized protein n=1 Tax=Trachymyrmex septentrionalis TaxID=34720 RepID=A0A195FP24_9HYME|nr:hypothetical protein ALC56_03453 [Trachymyrmex septentrionalis]